MIVTCPACSARYKINEAKIQGRGAKITCPRCAHRFVVYRDIHAAASPDDTGNRPVAPPMRTHQRDISTVDFSDIGLSWRVRRNGKVAYQFYDLATLQEYLQDGQIDRRDQISYDGIDWVRISDVSDLERHFWDVFQRVRRGEIAVTARPDEDEEEDDSDAPTTIVGRGSSIASEIRQAVSDATETPRSPGRGETPPRAAPSTPFGRPPTPARTGGAPRAVPSRPPQSERPTRAKPSSRPPDSDRGGVSRPPDVWRTPTTVEDRVDDAPHPVYGASSAEPDDDEPTPMPMPVPPRATTPPLSARPPSLPPRPSAPPPRPPPPALPTASRTGPTAIRAGESPQALSGRPPLMPIKSGAGRERVNDDPTVLLPPDEGEDGPVEAVRGTTTGKTPMPTWMPTELPPRDPTGRTPKRGRLSATASGSPMPPPPPQVKPPPRAPPSAAATVLPYVGLGFVGVLTMGLVLFILLYLLGVFSRPSLPIAPPAAPNVAPATETQTAEPEPEPEPEPVAPPVAPRAKKPPSPDPSPVPEPSPPAPTWSSPGSPVPAAPVPSAPAPAAPVPVPPEPAAPQPAAPEPAAPVPATPAPAAPAPAAPVPPPAPPPAPPSPSPAPPG